MALIITLIRMTHVIYCDFSLNWEVLQLTQQQKKPALSCSTLHKSQRYKNQGA